MKLTFAFCTYNRASRLPGLVAAMRAQTCPIPFEILAVNNNSSDDTLAVLETLAAQEGAPLRVVTETRQGIVPARNRVLQESLPSDIIAFIDDDELPQPGLLNAACDAILREGAVCVGGRIKVSFSGMARPRWLDEEIAGFLGELDHAPEPFWIETTATPVWSGNVAYDARLFRDNPALRFDERFNREGDGVGGGEDAMMFRTLLASGTRIRYRPDMCVLHAVEPEKLSRRYFLRLHFQAGVRFGRYQMQRFPATLLGVPGFLIRQCVRNVANSLLPLAIGKPGALRRAMNAAHSLGTLIGYRQYS